MRTNLSLVDRFFTALVEEVRQKAPSYLDSSFSVAEIYKSLVPYRTHRDVIGAEMNGDYEDALLRLLAGEGDYLFLESETARERIRLELRSSNPNTALYREYAAVGVRLNPEKAETVPARSGKDEGGEAPGSGVESQTELEVDDDELDALVEKTLEGSEVSRIADDLGLNELLSEESAGAQGETGGTAGVASSPADSHGEADGPEGRAAGAPAGDAPEAPSAATDTAREGGEGGAPDQGPEVAMPDKGSRTLTAGNGSSGSARPSRIPLHEIPESLNVDAPPTACPECDGNLPERDGLRFCPFCGTNVFVVPCGACGEVLERAWSFCIACGEPAS
jgi:hypothetical protein